MRTVSATLEAAQYAAIRTPYIHLLLTSYDGLTTYDLSSDSATYGNRILLVDHKEEAYRESATIALRNYDNIFDDIDFTGYWVDIGYGDVTGGGNEYSGTSRLWVKYQQIIVAQGKRLVILELTGKWVKLIETLLRLGDPPYYHAYTGAATGEDGYVAGYSGASLTIYDIIDYILTNHIDPAMTLAALAEDDGIIDTLIPVFNINEMQPFESAADAIGRLIRMTKSYLKPTTSLGWEIKFPQTTDLVDLTYYNNQSPYFYSYIERIGLVIPNRIYLFANAGSDGEWTNIITATANDTDSQAKYGIVSDVVTAPELTNQTDADNRAAAILARYKQEELGGKLLIPHDCQMELYDRVEAAITV